MKKPSVSYKNELLNDLSDPRACAEYLSFCWSESKETFLLGLKNVAQAQGGMKKLADAANVNRENLYHMLSDDGNPRLDSFTAIMSALGLDIEIVPKRSAASASKCPATTESGDHVIFTVSMPEPWSVSGIDTATTNIYDERAPAPSLIESIGFSVDVDLTRDCVEMYPTLPEPMTQGFCIDPMQPPSDY